MRYEEGYVEDTRGRTLSRYAHCRWCLGMGCNQCDIEAEKAYKAAFPDGPKPIATFKIPEEMEAAKSIIGAEAIDRAYGPGGRGFAEIIANCIAHEALKSNDQSLTPPPGA